jgi:hypothetical protein
MLPAWIARYSSAKRSNSSSFMDDCMGWAKPSARMPQIEQRRARLSHQWGSPCLHISTSFRVGGRGSNGRSIRDDCEERRNGWPGNLANTVSSTRWDPAVAEGRIGSMRTTDRWRFPAPVHRRRRGIAVVVPPSLPMVNATVTGFASTDDGNSLASVWKVYRLPPSDRQTATARAMF